MNYGDEVMWAKDMHKRERMRTTAGDKEKIKEEEEKATTAAEDKK
jgi:hypothetical protein